MYDSDLCLGSLRFALMSIVKLDCYAIVHWFTFLFTSTVKLTLSTKSNKPVLGGSLQFTASYQVNFNSVHVFCTTPTGEHIEPSEISPPDYHHIVTARFAVENTRSGQYKVSAASFIPHDSTYDEKKSTSTELLNIRCSGMSIAYTTW